MAEFSIAPTISTFLSSLRPTGSGGFEGFIAALCESATGQRFRLSASGQQTGQDARSEPGYGNCVKIETKHYSRASLDLRELTAELFQAVALGPETDLWVLAASCRVNDQHAAALENMGKGYGVELLFLDVGTDGLPRVAVLMASECYAVQRWIAQHQVAADTTPLHFALEQLRADQRFPTASAQILQKLNCSVLGYDAARQKAAERFLSAVRNSGEANAAFNQRVAIRDPAVRPVPRIGIADRLVAWWNASRASKRGVVLGEEGTGKTWAVVSWATQGIEAGTMPIVLPLFAGAESIGTDETIENVLPRLLARWTGLGTPQSWALRMERWLADPSSDLLLLVIVDGLNERPTLPWPSFFRSLDRERWQRHVAVLVTDRPGHWRPNCATAGLDGFTEISIDGYTDWELEQVLAGRGIGISRILPDLQALIRKPRYCELVCDHFDEMNANADFTVERLIWLDAKHRSQTKRGPLTEEAFIEVIRNLAISYRTRPTINLSGVQRLVPFADPDRRIHQEIIDGGLLIRQVGLGATYSIERTRLVFGLGMLLASELRETAAHVDGPAHLEDELASWFEPHPEMDLKEQVCGAALFHSLIDPQYPAAARRELLRYWLGSRNQIEETPEAFEDYVLRCPEDFIAVLPECWASDRNLGPAQDFLARTFTKHRNAAAVRGPLTAAVARWMGLVHPAGHPVMRPTDEHEARNRQQIAARVGCSLAPGPIEVLGETLEVIEDEGLLRLSRFGFLLISAGPRKPFLHGMVRWALASAVMGAALERPAADWVIRLAEDPIEADLLAEARRLLGLRHPLADGAAHTLLSILGSAEARRLCDQHPLPEDERWAQLQRDHKRDPCRSPLPWDDADCERCLEREDVPTLTIIARLGERVLDPTYPFSRSFLDRTSRLLQIDPNLIRATLSATMEQHAYDSALPVLGTRAPKAVTDFLARVIATLPERSWDRVYPLAIWLPEVALVLGWSEIEIVRAKLRALQGEVAAAPPGAPQGPDSARRVAEAFMFMATVPHMTSAECFSALLARPLAAYDLRQFEHLFEPLSEVAARQALELIQSATEDVTVVRALWFLGSTKVVLSPDDRDRLIELAQSKNPLLRGAVMRFALLLEDEILGRRLVDLGGVYRERTEAWDLMWGARVLTRFSSHLPFEAIARRLHPADAGFALAHRGCSADEVEIYAMGLDANWRAIIAASDPSLLSLPLVIADPTDSGWVRGFPEFSDEGSAPSFGFRDPSTSWFDRNPDASRWPNLLDQNRVIEERNRLSQERVETVTAAWRTDALEWYGRDFSRVALQAICERYPDMVTHWVEPALGDGPIGQIHRTRFGSFLAKLCPALLESLPTLGVRLWRVLRRDESSPVRFKSATAAFQAPENDWANEARCQVIEEALDDAAIAKVAYIAESASRQGWLRSAIEQMIASPALWRRAKGLTFASFMDLAEPEFEACIARARVENTWVESQLPWLRGNIKRNRFAQHWHQLFLDAADSGTSWGAWQTTMRCGDERFFLWGSLGTTPEDATVARRIHFVTARGDQIEQKLDHERNRKETLFGIKIERGEIFPFFPR